MLTSHHIGLAFVMIFYAVIKYALCVLLICPYLNNQYKQYCGWNCMLFMGLDDKAVFVLREYLQGYYWLPTTVAGWVVIDISIVSG